MKVADIMQTDVDFVTSDTLLLEVARIIFGHGVNGLPVCEGKRIIGFISERDILSKFYPTIQEYIMDPVHTSDFELMEKNVSEILNLPAKDIMSRNPTVITADTPVLRAQSTMAVKKVGRLPVVDEKGNLIGILSKGDIFKAVVGQKLPFEEEEQFHDWLSRRYDRIIDWKERLSKEIPDLVSLFKKEKVKTIVDMGCGTGVHAISLAKEGFSVIGIDKSPRMIFEAKQKIKSLPIAIKKRIQFLNLPYKNLDVALRNAKFDAGMFLGSGLAHQPNPVETLSETNKILSNNSLLICQIANAEKIIKVNKRLFDFSVREFPFGRQKEHAFLRFYDVPKDDKIGFTVCVFEKARNWVFRGMHTIILTHLTQEKMKSYLTKLDFQKITFYGEEKGFYYDYLFRKPFKPLESDAMVVVAKR